MKKTLIILLLCTGCKAAIDERLLSAIEQVESGGKADAMGDKDPKTGEYRAMGSFQLWTIFVDDVNRIYGTKYSYEDRKDRKKSYEMAKKYIEYYGKGATIEQKARIFNGGPKGDTKKSTLKYWLKVKKEMEKN